MKINKYGQFLVYKLKYEWHYLAGEIKDLAWCGENKRIVVAGDGQGNCANAFMFDTGSKLGDFVGISKRLNSCDIRKQKPFKTLVGGDDFSSVFYEGPPVKFIKTNKKFRCRILEIARSEMLSTMQLQYQNIKTNINGIFLLFCRYGKMRQKN